MKILRKILVYQKVFPKDSEKWLCQYEDLGKVGKVVTRGPVIMLH